MWKKIRSLIYFLKFKLAGGSCNFTVKFGRVTCKGGAKNIRIGNHTIIGDSVFFRDLGGIDIGKSVIVEDDVLFLSASHNVSDDSWRIQSAPISIGDYVLIGYGSILLPGVRVESNSVVPPGSVIRGNFNSNGR